MSSQPNQVYPAFKRACLRSQVDVETVDLVLVLVTGAYVYDAAHDNLAHLTGVLATSPPLTSVVVSGDGEVFADPVTVSSIGPGDAVEAAVLVTEDDLLVSFMARRGDSVPLVYPTDGGSITFTWTGRLLKI